MNDIEISKKSIKKPITEIVSNIGLNESDISIYGKYKAKIDLNATPKNTVIPITLTASLAPYLSLTNKHGINSNKVPITKYVSKVKSAKFI